MRLTKAKAMPILSSWGISDFSIKMLKGGYVNNNWLVESHGKRYVLRNETFFDRKEFGFKLAYLHRLHAWGFPYDVPLPIKAKNGREWMDRNEEIFWLYDYIDGDVKWEVSRPDLREIGKMIGVYHRLLVRHGVKGGVMDDPFRANTLRKTLESNIRRVARKKSRKRLYVMYLKEAGRLLPVLKKLDFDSYRKFEYYRIHRDMNPTNLVWKKGRLVGVLDWEQMFYPDVLVRDLVPILVHATVVKGHRWVLDFRRVGPFIRGYASVRKPSHDELRLLPFLMAANYIEDFDYGLDVMEQKPERKLEVRYSVWNARGARWQYKNRRMVADKLIRAASRKAKK